MSDARVRELVRVLLLDMKPAEVLEHVTRELALPPGGPPIGQLWEFLERWREWKAESPEPLSSGHLMVSLAFLRFHSEADALGVTLDAMDARR